MKTKSFLVFSTSVFAISIFLIVFHSQPPPSIQNIVSQTHQQIKDFQENLRDAEASLLVPEELVAGGALAGPRWHNTTLPALVTHASADQHAEAISFIRAAARLPYTVLLYNLGLKPYSLVMVQSYCNSSKCMVVDFDLEEFPSHVRDESIHAFRPLIVQHALSRVGGVIYCDPGVRWEGSAEELAGVWARAAAPGALGVVAWARRAAVTSLTHPRMFHYLHAALDDFLFVPMVEGDRLVVCASPAAAAVVRPWLRCALTLDCVMPLGAQAAGCRFDKKPQYRYSGCHGRDASALSIILGLRAGFEDSKYAARAGPWRRVPPERARAELEARERNYTAAERADPADARTTTARPHPRPTAATAGAA